MAQITNLTREGLDFVLIGPPKDGVPPTGHVKAGETAELAVDPDSAHIKGMILGGAISISTAKTSAPKRGAE